ncbi:MAG TPA: ATP-binding protein [Chloroflexota bacterium]|nr:ATP-binding protein [Chloroflexota bacterium]
MSGGQSDTLRTEAGVPTLYVMVGLPAVGKTHRAMQLEESVPALRLTKDEWMLPLFGNLEDENQRDVVEGRLVWLALRALRLGISVVLDFGVWSRVERSALRRLGREAGAKVELVYVNVDQEAQRRQRDHREVKSPHLTIPMSDELLATYRSKFEAPTEDELCGTADDPPPPGFATWRAWAADRWPSSMDRR